jgi:hypothetical protein
MDLVFRSHLEMTVDELLFAGDHRSVLLVPHLRKNAQDVARMADAITAIRQLCLMFGKEKELCSATRTKAAYDAFIETDKELDAPLGTSELQPSSREECSPTPEGRSD